MADYTELVKKLRNRRVCIQRGGNGDDFRIWSDAAVAIERLQNELEYTSRQYELALEDLEKAEQPTSVMEYPQVDGITSTLITP